MQDKPHREVNQTKFIDFRDYRLNIYFTIQKFFLFFEPYRKLLKTKSKYNYLQSTFPHFKAPASQKSQNFVENSFCCNPKYAELKIFLKLLTIEAVNKYRAVDAINWRLRGMRSCILLQRNIVKQIESVLDLYDDFR